MFKAARRKAGLIAPPERRGTIDRLTLEEELRFIDRAYAKGGRTGVEVYDERHERHSPARLALAGELRAAIDDAELVVHFQPKVSMRTGHVVGVEALVRWQHPERGLVPPVEFVPVAEQTGLMRPLTMLVLRRSLTACARWRAAGHDLTVAVNVAAANLLDDEFPATVEELLGESGVAPGRPQALNHPDTNKSLGA